MAEEELEPLRDMLGETIYRDALKEHMRNTVRSRYPLCTARARVSNERRRGETMSALFEPAPNLKCKACGGHGYTITKEGLTPKRSMQLRSNLCSL